MIPLSDAVRIYLGVDNKKTILYRLRLGFVLFGRVDRALRFLRMMNSGIEYTPAYF